jgi:Raf kinase inhibitor-like YbhB/YbcL family protein
VDDKTTSQEQNVQSPTPDQKKEDEARTQEAISLIDKNPLQALLLSGFNTARKAPVALVTLLLVVGVALSVFSSMQKTNIFQRASGPQPTISVVPSVAPITRKMTISSIAFENQKNIPVQYTCVGRGVNPPLQFSDIPQGTKTLALLVDDPDAPGGTWVHWVVFNIDPKVSNLAENSKPAGTEGTTSFGNTGYGGPCPTSGTHRYFFKLYALDTRLNLSATTNKKAVENAMQGHIIEQSELVGLFSK